MKKIFLHIVFNILVFLSISFASCQASSGLDNLKEIEVSSGVVADKEGMTVKGRVLDNENHPVAGVVISDGTHFTETSCDGIYYLPANLASSKYVTISTPADYEISSDKGIACGFYAQLTTGEKVNQRNFTLKKRTSTSDQFTYIAISDPQVKNITQLSRFQNETVSDLKNYAIENAGREILGMTLGDNVFDAMGLFPSYKSSVSSLGITMFHTIGNHDFDLNYNDRHNTTDPLSNYAEQNYELFFGPTDYSFNVGHVHVVTMKSTDYFKGKNYYTRFTTEQLEWLKKDLSYLKPGSLVFLNLHVPTSNQSSDGNISNATELMHILKDYRVHIFAGHTHFYENVEVSPAIYQHNIGAACGAWWAGDVNRDGSPNGFLIVDVNGDEVKWHYKATGKNLNYQFRVYKPGEFATQAGYVVVNFWDCDGQCRVNWYEDGVLKGGMEQFSDEDQDFVTMNGRAKGYQTLHLFRAKPSTGAQNITIEVTNRFGEVYKENISF